VKSHHFIYRYRSSTAWSRALLFKPIDSPETGVTLQLSVLGGSSELALGVTLEDEPIESSSTESSTSDFTTVPTEGTTELIIPDERGELISA